MFTNWRPKAIAVGGFLLALITWLQFFGIDARTLREQMTSHYLLLLLAVIFTLAFVAGIYYWVDASRTTRRNIQRRITEWLIAFNYSQRPAPWQGVWHFGFEVTITGGPLLLIGRPIAAGDYLVFLGRLIAVSPKHRSAFDALTESEREKFNADLGLEIARAKILFRPDNALDQVSIEKWVPITSKLTAPVFLDVINEMYFSAHIIWNAIAIRLGGKAPTPTPPSSAPDTEALPPSQA